MRCPHCRKHIAYPTQRQLLAWTYRYFGKATWEDITPIKEVAQRMNISRDAVLKLLQELRKSWPQLAPKKDRKKKTYIFDEMRDSEVKIHF